MLKVVQDYIGFVSLCSLTGLKTFLSSSSGNRCKTKTNPPLTSHWFHRTKSHVSVFLKRGGNMQLHVSVMFNMHKKWSGSVVYAATETRENVTKVVVVVSTIYILPHTAVENGNIATVSSVR